MRLKKKKNERTKREKDEAAKSVAALAVAVRQHPVLGIVIGGGAWGRGWGVRGTGQRRCKVENALGNEQEQQPREAGAAGDAATGFVAEPPIFGGLVERIGVVCTALGAQEGFAAFFRDVVTTLCT